MRWPVLVLVIFIVIRPVMVMLDVVLKLVGVKLPAVRAVIVPAGFVQRMSAVILPPATE